jgi:hypothetical protein
VGQAAALSGHMPVTRPTRPKQGDHLPLNKGDWEERTIEDIFMVTLRVCSCVLSRISKLKEPQKEKWMAASEYIWMQSLSLELAAESASPNKRDHPATSNGGHQENRTIQG